jgi:uncharacterized Zn finger protein
MKSENLLRFDIDALRELAGEKAFARGEAYHRDGQAAILSIERNRVLAQVEGGENYRTEVTGRGREIGGECSCPAFDDWGFCKHMVAAALAANAAVGAGGPDDDGVLGRIRAHLKEQGIDTLVEMIIDMAERDPALFRRLDMAAATARADDTTIEPRLRKAIDDATRIRGFVDYREAAGWAEGVSSVLDALADLELNRRAGIALRLAERAIDRIEQALGEIDDSDGECGDLLQRARDIHLAAARAAQPEPVALARTLFAREMNGEWGTFDGAAALYAEVLGAAGLAEYRRLAREAWEQLPPRSGETRSRERDDSSLSYQRLLEIVDFFAERDGDVEARIALRTKDLSAPWSYLKLAKFCLSQGREDEALRRAEDGLWMFEDGPADQRLVLFTADLLVKAGRNCDAEARLWHAFVKTPSLELYRRLREFGAEGACQRAIDILEARIAKEAATHWHHPADLLIGILIEEEKFDAAWAALRRHGASVGMRESLAASSEATHPREAIEVYAARVEMLANAGGDRAYTEAIRLVARIAALQSPADQVSYVTGLKMRFRRKRNLMKLLA